LSASATTDACDAAALFSKGLDEARRKHGEALRLYEESLALLREACIPTGQEI
jgi:hypothetical protein